MIMWLRLKYAAWRVRKIVKQTLKNMEKQREVDQWIREGLLNDSKK